MEDQIFEVGDVDSGKGRTNYSTELMRPHINAFEQSRPAFAPPSTPLCWRGIARQENGTMRFEHCPFVCDGRR